jgi:hypothetical protein
MNASNAKIKANKLNVSMVVVDYYYMWFSEYAFSFIQLVLVYNPVDAIVQ